jgi:5'-3' exonuclease, N-terminal resolvase-like domain
MKALIDADIVTFRAAFTAEDEEEAWVACVRADQLLQDIIAEVGAESYELWLSGDNNFRYTVYPEYKANRIGAKRPKWEKAVKDFLVAEWEANYSEGCEADDMLGLRQTNDTIICTIDKDLDQISGWHYNFVKKTKYYIDEADAFRFFCYQLMVGDTADGIKGVQGIGPKKAERFLTSHPPEEWLGGIRDMYSCQEEFDLNAKVLWIRRPDGENPPVIQESSNQEEL